MTARALFVLPVFGSPFLLGVVNTKDSKKHQALILKGVGGDCETAIRDSFFIHPMFCKENKRWAIAEILRRNRNTRIYCDENGVERCSVNMATVLMPDYRNGGCPHLWGDLVMDVPLSAVKKLDYPLDCLTLASVCEASEDDEDEEAMRDTCKRNGWEWLEDVGQIFKKACEAPVKT